jgi:hypothetical protein
MNTLPYIGIPYVSKGRDRNGVDCYGIIYLAFKEERGIDLPSWNAEYENARRTSFDKVVSKSSLFDQWEKVEHPTEWDVGLFRMGGLFHAVLCIDTYGSRMMHISSGTKFVCIDRIDSMVFKDRYKEWYRYVG